MKHYEMVSKGKKKESLYETVRLCSLDGVRSRVHKCLNRVFLGGRGTCLNKQLSCMNGLPVGRIRPSEKKQLREEALAYLEDLHVLRIQLMSRRCHRLGCCRLGFRRFGGSRQQNCLDFWPESSSSLASISNAKTAVEYSLNQPGIGVA